MRLKSRGIPFVTRRGAQIYAVVFCAILAGIPLAAQESEVQKDVPYVPTPPEVVEAMLKLGNTHAGTVSELEQHAITPGEGLGDVRRRQHVVHLGHRESFRKLSPPGGALEPVAGIGLDLPLGEHEAEIRAGG